jgi:MoxR-like ATPase
MKLTSESLHQGLEHAGYLTTPGVEVVLFLAVILEKPLLLEGPAGAGKTEIGKVLPQILRTNLIRLQCYEGLDEAKALYEWNHQNQLLRIQADRVRDVACEDCCWRRERA